MKKIITLGLAILLSVSFASAQKVLEASAKKAPDWLGGVQTGSIVSTIDGPTLAKCQEGVLTDIKVQIAMAIGTNVSVSQSNEITSVSTNAGVAESDVFKSSSKMNAANLPILKGITLSKATDSYWYKTMENGKVKYTLSVLYPFSDSDLNALISEYEDLVKQHEAELQEIASQIDALDQVSQIKQNILKLEAIKKFFVDEVSISNVDAVIKQYQGLYNQLSVSTSFTGEGECIIQLLLNGNPIGAPAPKVRGSECLANIDVKTQDGAYIVSYDAQDCMEEDENTLDISFICEGKTIKKKAPLTVKNGGAADKAAFSVVPEGKIFLQAESSTGSAVTNVSIRISLNNRGGLPFGLKSIELDVPELTAPIVFDDADVVYRQKGIVQIKALAEGTFNARKVTKSAVNYVKGSVTLLNPETKAVETIKINLPYSTNWGK